MANEPKTIMIIEDDHFLSSLMKSRLEKEGFAVIQAFDGEEAMHLLKETLPSLIVLDLVMPKVTGFEVLQMTPLAWVFACLALLFAFRFLMDMGAMPRIKEPPKKAKYGR